MYAFQNIFHNVYDVFRHFAFEVQEQSFSEVETLLPTTMFESQTFQNVFCGCEGFGNLFSDEPVASLGTRFGNSSGQGVNIPVL